MVPRSPLQAQAPPRYSPPAGPERSRGSSCAGVRRCAAENSRPRPAAGTSSVAARQPGQQPRRPEAGSAVSSDRSWRPAQCRTKRPRIREPSSARASSPIPSITVFRLHSLTHSPVLETARFTRPLQAARQPATLPCPHPTTKPPGVRGSGPPRRFGKMETAIVPPQSGRGGRQSVPCQPDRRTQQSDAQIM